MHMKPHYRFQITLRALAECTEELQAIARFEKTGLDGDEGKAARELLKACLVLVDSVTQADNSGPIPGMEQMVKDAQDAMEIMFEEANSHQATRNLKG